MYSFLDRAFKYVVTRGTLQVTAPDGQLHHYGDGTGKPVGFRITSHSWARRIAVNPDLNIGEAYMAGGLVMELGTIYDAVDVLLANAEAKPYTTSMKWASGLRRLVKRLDQHNPVGKAKANVAHHYDLSGQLYDLFLDRDRQYSCAYFETLDQTLEEAQLAKKRHLVAKLNIRPGMKILDIGSGWGGLGLYLAEIAGAQVTGVTLSEEQHKLSNERARQRGLDHLVQFRLLDYRSLSERFDRIVSVGMFEHVGVGHYPEFFAKAKALLKDDGIALLHSINRADGAGATSAWIKKYIFPGGYIPALSEVLPHLEYEKLYVTDIEVLRLHYARTIQEWAKRFAANRERAREIYDERFCRMWEFYLAASEASFRHSYLNNFQIQFTRDQHVLPLTRDYIAAAEARLRQAEEKRPRLMSVPAE
jgi:cyclopropane-fatty-acyl-phospholipid synthase